MNGRRLIRTLRTDIKTGAHPNFWEAIDELQILSVSHEQKEFGATLSVATKDDLFYEFYLRNATCALRFANIAFISVFMQVIM